MLTRSGVTFHFDAALANFSNIRVITDTRGDINSNSKRYTLINEDGEVIGRTSRGIQCGSAITDVFELPVGSVAAWSVDGNISITAVPDSAVDFFCAVNSMTMTLAVSEQPSCAGVNKSLSACGSDELYFKVCAHL